jgi:hypothetical protein
VPTVARIAVQHAEFIDLKLITKKIDNSVDSGIEFKLSKY